MKILRLLTLFLLVSIVGCSKDNDSATTENGTNRAPNLKTTGSSARDFLTSEEHSALAIEILYVNGFEPTAQTLTNLQSFLQARLNKPNGITVSARPITSSGTSPYDLNEISKLEADNRTKYNNTGILTLCILFVDGNFTTDTATQFTLGTAYRNTSCVVYENSVRKISTASGKSLANLESIVILHEIGHLLGLVDLGTKMQSEHLDEAHGKHCDNPNCLMYWETESNIMNMMGAGIPNLDTNCLADLKANGGK